MARAHNQLEYPKFLWPASGWVFTVIGALAGLAVILFPTLLQLPGTYRVFVCVLLFLLPTAVILSLYLIKCATVFVRRARHYGALSNTIGSLESRLGATERSLMAFLEERKRHNAFDIAYCYGYGQRTFIAIRKKRGPAVSTGVDVRVFEQSSGGLLGEFRILNEIDGHYVCELVGYMDALWMGYVKQVGSQHSIPPPEALAWVLVKNIGETNERSEEQN